MAKTDEPKAICPDCGNYDGGKCYLYRNAKANTDGDPLILTCTHFNNANLPNSDIALAVPPKDAEQAVIDAQIDANPEQAVEIDAAGKRT
jgi:hypothetical protein